MGTSSSKKEIDIEKIIIETPEIITDDFINENTQYFKINSAFCNRSGYVNNLYELIFELYEKDYPPLNTNGINYRINNLLNKSSLSKEFILQNAYSNSFHIILYFYDKMSIDEKRKFLLDECNNIKRDIYFNCISYKKLNMTYDDYKLLFEKISEDCFNSLSLYDIFYDKKLITDEILDIIRNRKINKKICFSTFSIVKIFKETSLTIDGIINNINLINDEKTCWHSNSELKIILYDISKIDHAKYLLLLNQLKK